MKKAEKMLKEAGELAEKLLREDPETVKRLWETGEASPLVRETRVSSLFLRNTRLPK